MPARYVRYTVVGWHNHISMRAAVLLLVGGGKVSNPSFEQDSVEAASGREHRLPTSWDGNGSVAIVQNESSGGGGLSSGRGSQFVQLQSRGSFVAQALTALTPGRDYILTFLVAGRVGLWSANATVALVVSAGGMPILTAAIEANTDFTEYGAAFHADNLSVTVRFENDASCNGSIFIDDVSASEDTGGHSKHPHLEHTSPWLLAALRVRQPEC